ncbi:MULTISPECIES: hypothetical protein [Halococcus]|uniref:Uncharacterized protein n=1 Tax=Halococcus salifodinae DSM 8989 TaxID=1227456 RepID=M0N2C0_9EURY|nr:MULTISPECIES: hypothetical protein [Halococcus]EMA51284.1 hypothetical protein C450_12440 [Halococcus salifodinae DSM 8989]
MAQRNPRLWENSHFREGVGTVAVLAVLLVFTEMTLQSIIPLVILVGGVVGHDIADGRYDLPDGTNLLVYGTTVVIAGAYLAVLGGMWVGGLLALVGCWFVFDGATTVRYEPHQTTHEYVSGLDDQANEVMLRMQTLNSVYQRLRTVGEPQTPAELAADLGLTESRTESALDFLVSKGRVEQTGRRYRANPSRWGRLEPAARFLRWLPRRILRPFSRIAANT